MDARFLQITALSVALILGIFYKQWHLNYPVLFAAIECCLIAQLYWNYWLFLPKNGILSAVITSLSLCILLRTDNVVVMSIASLAAISSKYIFRRNGKHYFNPANFGINMALLLGGYVTPGQWGIDGWLSILFIGAAWMVLGRVGRWDIAISFYVTYGLLVALYADIPLLLSGSTLLFALFMITDPRSTPNSRIGRIIFAMVVAIVAFILRVLLDIPSGVFVALFVCSPLSAGCDRVFNGTRFEW